MAVSGGAGAVVVASAPSPATAMPVASAAGAVHVRGMLDEAELVSITWAAGAAVLLPALCLRSAVGAICAEADAAAASCVGSLAAAELLAEGAAR